MAGLKGNVAWLAAAKQTVKGTANTTYAYTFPFSGGNIQPTREVGRLAETDSSRDQGTAFVARVGVEGTPEVYVRDASLPFWIHAAFGTTGTAGATNYTHTQTTGVTDLPYLTLARNIGNSLYEQFEDCKVTSLTVRAGAGEPLTAAIGIIGRQAKVKTVAPTPPATQSGAVYSYNEAAVTLGGGATSLISGFETTLENGVSSQQTDDYIPYDVVEGQRSASVGFDMIFESPAEYYKFHYGPAPADGTVQTGTLFETSAVFTFTKGANNEIKFDFLHLVYEEFPVEPDPGGEPVTASVRGATVRHPTDPVLRITTKNQVASY
jgi:hypothetical protein